MRVPGASQTVLGIDCPYAKVADQKAVSVERAFNLAQDNLDKATKLCPDSRENLFGLCITGAHYPNKRSHAWMTLITPSWNAYMHCSMSADPDRATIGRLLVEKVMFFLEGCLLGVTNWRDHIASNPLSDGSRIDVLYAPV